MSSHSSTLEDVRDQWERIKFSYEILSDRQTRNRYNRHEVLADPGSALGRAAQEAVVRGVMGLGHAAFRAAAFAVEQATTAAATVDKKADEQFQPSRWPFGVHSNKREKRVSPPLAEKLSQFVFQNMI